MVFLFKLTICWGLFALLYTLLLRRETFFRLNRGYLLGTAVLGIGLAGASERLLPALKDETGVAVTMLPEFTVGLHQTETVIRQWDLMDYGWIIYGAGVFVTLLRMLWGLTRLLNMAVRGHRERLPDGCILIQTTQTVVPFSFFKWVFVPLLENHPVIGHSNTPTPPALSQADPNFELLSPEARSNFELILSHERAHAHGWHSADVLLTELLCIACWFHPLAHWYRRALRTVHEYLADAEVARHTDKKQYGLLLIRQAQSGPALALVHHFFQSPLKQRLIMLMRPHSAPVRALQYGLVLPLSLLIGLLFQQNHTLAQAAPAKDESGQLPTAACDVMPGFPGGQSALFKFLNDHLQYPEAAQKNGVQGSVILSFTVEKDGALSGFSSKTSDPSQQSLVEEAIRVARTMPKWTPGQQQGQAVRCSMTLPVQFRLPEAAKAGDDAPAQFPGGEAALMKYLGEQIKYPETARKANASGMAVIEFMIDTDGSITEVASLKDNIAKELQEEAVRVIKAMPKWVPAIQEGKIVKSKMTLPIRFKL